MLDNREALLVGLQGDSLRDAFGKHLVALASKYPDVVVLDADVAGGTGIHHFRKAFPGRFYQCGIAEQNMMAMAGGMAATGLIPFVTTFAVFALRAVEQARLSIAYPKMNVKIVASHPGLDVGPDGASAQCFEDLAVFRAIPGMVVVSPCDFLETQQATEAILQYRGPVYMRTGRSAAKPILDNSYEFVLGKAQILKDGRDVTLIGCGVTTTRALEAAVKLETENISARVVNMSTLKPIDGEMLKKCALETQKIITIEDHNVHGGLGGAVAEYLVQHHPVPMKILGINDKFGESGEPDELAEKYGIDVGEIIRQVKQLIGI